MFHLYQSAYVFLKKSGACSGRVPGVLFLLQFFKKILGCVLGVLFLLQFKKKNLGRVPGVFSVFSVFQSLSNSQKKGKTKVAFIGLH